MGNHIGNMFRHPQALVDPKNPRWPPLSKIILAVGGTAIFFPIAPRIKKSAILWFLGMGNQMKPYLDTPEHY